MQKKLIIALLVAVILWLLVGLIGGTEKNINTGLVGGELLVSVFTNDDREATGKILIQVPFLESVKNAESISIAVDSEGKGTFETLVSDFPVSPVANWRSGYYADTTILESPIKDGTKAKVTISSVDYDVVVKTKIVQVGELFDLASVTDPENSMKGWGASVAHAQGGSVEIVQEGVPDLTQRIGECAPTAAANSLISLINKNGGEDLLPGDPEDFIRNLKRHMNWTVENGVPPDDFVAGKNRWAAAAGVPIKTTKVGDTHGVTTIDAIRTALQNGDAVELRIKFGDANGKAVGGHMVTVTGIHQQDGQTYLDINDPATADSGTETVEIRSNQITNYGPWKGLTVLSWGFVQTWEGHPTGTLLDTMTDEEIAGVRQFAGETPMITVIEYKGKYLPVDQLVVQDEIGCGARHYHAEKGIVTATDKTKVKDPGPQCGYGKVSDLPSINIPAPNNND